MRALRVRFLPIAERIELSGPAKGILATSNPVSYEIVSAAARNESMRLCSLSILGRSAQDDVQSTCPTGKPRWEKVDQSGWVFEAHATHQRLKLDP
jgi:hypothetical protein